MPRFLQVWARCALILICVRSIAATGQQVPPTSPNDNLTCTIEGTVTDGAGQPIDGAEVRAVALYRYTATTDVDGHYLLRVPPGLYGTFALKPNFVGPHRTVAVQARKPEQIELKLYRESVLSGRVTDEHGAPIAKADIQLWWRGHRWGRTEFYGGGSARTDEAGGFTVKGLRQGEYYVSVRAPLLEVHPVSAASAKPKPGSRTGYAVAIYPGVGSFEYAQPIRIGAEENRELMDFVLRKVPTYCIRAVITPVFSGKNANSAGVSIAQLATGWRQFVAMGRTNLGERLEVCGLVPGVEYEMDASQWNDVGQGATQSNSNLRYAEALGPISASGGIGSFVRWTFTGSAKDVETGVLDLGSHRLQTGVTVQGSITIADRRDGESVPKVSIGLMPRGRYQFLGEGSEVLTDGTDEFTFANVMPDEHWLRAPMPSRNYYVKSARDNRRDLLVEPWQPGGGPIRIILARGGASVTGRVTDREGNPVLDAQVLLLPKDIGSRSSRASVSSAAVDQYGQFYFRFAITPGEYRLVAVRGLPEGQAEDPQIAAEYLSESVEASLSENERRYVTLIAQPGVR